MRRCSRTSDFKTSNHWGGGVVVDNNKNHDNDWAGNRGIVSRLLSLIEKSFRILLARASVRSTYSTYEYSTTAQP